MCDKSWIGRKIKSNADVVYEIVDVKDDRLGTECVVARDEVLHRYSFIPVHRVCNNYRWVDTGKPCKAGGE